MTAQSDRVKVGDRHLGYCGGDSLHLVEVTHVYNRAFTARSMCGRPVVGMLAQTKWESRPHLCSRCRKYLP